MTKNRMYQVSTLQALALGYSRPVVTVGELMENGDTGLGTFEAVDGEMILIDGRCFRATQSGDVVAAPADMGVPFASVTFLDGARRIELSDIPSLERLKTELDLKIEEEFGLNSMHVVRIDGDFEDVSARSVSAHPSQHVELTEILQKKQKEFRYASVRGSLICVYYPDYMDGINAAGWHFHLISGDRTKGGHVMDLRLRQGSARMKKLSGIEIQLPREAAFDTYALKEASKDDIKKAEQGNVN